MDVSELQSAIVNQMQNLSSQISDIEKQMGLDSSGGRASEGTDAGKEGDLEGLSEKELGKNETGEQKRAKELRGAIDEIGGPGGSQPGGDLYSSEPEKIETLENAEEFGFNIKGTKDETGAMRETISSEKGESTTKRRLPTAGYDDTAELSTQQAEDDAIKNTSIPLEYEEIIKKIHTNK